MARVLGVVFAIGLICWLALLLYGGLLHLAGGLIHALLVIIGILLIVIAGLIGARMLTGRTTNAP